MLNTVCNYMEEIMNANVVVCNNGGIHLQYNGVSDICKYRPMLLKKEIDFVGDYCEKQALPTAQQNSFNKACSRYLQEAMNCFPLKENGEICHSHLTITHTNGEPVSEEALSLQSQDRIREFVYSQYESLLRTVDVLSDLTNCMYFPFAWGYKQIELVEFGHILLICRCIIPIGQHVSQSHWFRALFQLLHQPPPCYIDQTIYKITHREQPDRFLSKLLSLYNKSLENI